MITIKQLEINRWHDGHQERYDAGGGCYIFMFIKTKAVLVRDGRDRIPEKKENPRRALKTDNR